MIKKSIREPLTVQEADDMCQACENFQEKLIIWTLLDTGLRVAELCNLTSQQIQWQQKVICVSGKGDVSGRLSKKRVVPLSSRVLTLFEHYFAINDKWPVGARQAQKIVKLIANKAKITQTVTPNILRHTFATLALKKGISLVAVQKILGQDRLRITSIYLNLTDTHILEEYSGKW